MVAETSGWGSKLFPEIRIRFAARAPVLLPPWVQAGVLSGMIAGAGALAYLGVSRLGYERLAADKDLALVHAETANAGLQGDLSELQDKVVELTRDRDQAQSRVAALANQADTLRGLLQTTESKLQSLGDTQSRLSQQRAQIEQQGTASAAAASVEAGQIAQLSQALDQTRQALRQEQAESTALSARLSKTEADRIAEAARFAQYKASLEETAKKLQQLDNAHGRGAVHRARLRVRLGELWQKLSQAPLPPPFQQPAAAALVAAGAPAAPNGKVAQVTDLGAEGVAAFEHVLASTGIDVARLFSEFRANGGEGGPFVPPPKDNQPADAVDPDKLAAIRGLASVLPLSAPLARYEIGSPFGTRADPFNHRAAFHTGIDMDAPYMSAVYATAPGTVVYAGYLGDYGKVVEINHGFGIETLYAHLHRYLVSVGQNVAAQTEIGLVGTTGRSTGPHVHYEVRVNGQPQDPAKFMALSRLIPIATPAVTPTAGAPAANSH